MHTLLSVLATLVRLLRPARGLHAGPGDFLRELQAEARARRANRVRRYAADPVPARPAGPGYVYPSPCGAAPLEAGRTSRVPAPRRSLDKVLSVALRPAPTDYVPVVDPEGVQPPAAMVRGYYCAHEASQDATRATRMAKVTA
ncbi:Uncharacterised protein [Nocardiopsis dassonvillei]|uniref:Uncharacterized protein n=1 Tax=Nocardiopsis dassonvillei (strain ATCC 23218 / DSM 43111 / CIP 107115 / JCM 7437 / KCTC 9190 / NBRC 14626 / NCTC 10488 / NRRL B-5397 / IMRU 509) TaxID=446468 RepID=D7AX90_NOCDD|nr:conserved hypothetical protein [Nocardiopsis dassonvillei subsp. dassonvillei DSM 43111]VEI91985.1 Uncharacterised protein [Nocardiopsis dassonvillei]